MKSEVRGEEQNRLYHEIETSVVLVPGEDLVRSSKTAKARLPLCLTPDTYPIEVCSVVQDPNAST